MAKGTRYRRLAQHLAAQRGAEVHLSFTEIESVSGYVLPPSARRHRPWWANDQSHGEATAWLSEGWQATAVSLDAEHVTYRRLPSSS